MQSYEIKGYTWLEYLAGVLEESFCLLFGETARHKSRKVCFSRDARVSTKRRVAQARDNGAPKTSRKYAANVLN